MNRSTVLSVVGLLCVAMCISGGGCGTTAQPDPCRFSLTVSPTSVNLAVGASAAPLAVSVTSTGECDSQVRSTVRYESADPGIATVDSTGVITGAAPGTTSVEVTVSLEASTTADDTEFVEVVVRALNVTGVTLTPSSLSLAVGETSFLEASVAGDAGVSQEVTFEASSSRISLTKVAPNRASVVGVTAGPDPVLVTVRSTADPSQFAVATVTVQEGARILSVTVDPTIHTMDVGSNKVFTATVASEGVINTDVTWSIAPQGIATFELVQNNIAQFTGVGRGDAVITVTSVADPSKRGTAALRIDKAPEVLSVGIPLQNQTREPGQTVQYAAQVVTDPVDAQIDRSVRWFVVDGTAATIDSVTGLATASSSELGTATIRAVSVFDRTKSSETTLIVACGDPGPGLIVFRDAFGPGISYAPYASDFTPNLPVIDNLVTQECVGSFRFDINFGAKFEATGSANASTPQDVSQFNALTFWARDSDGNRSNLTDAGFGNPNNSGTHPYWASWSEVPIDGTWKKFVFPLLDPSKLTSVTSLFAHFTRFHLGDSSSLWIDNVRYESVSGISNIDPAMTSFSREYEVGDEVSLFEVSTRVAVDGLNRLIVHSPWFFNYTSSDESVAKVGDRKIEIVGPGTATITAKLGNVTVETSPGSGVEAKITVTVSDETSQ